MTREAGSPAATKLAFVPYSPELDQSIADFNRRLEQGPAEPEFTLQVGQSRLLFTPDETVSEERFLAIEGEAVRGGVVLQVQPFMVGGETRRVANVQLPVSEGIVDRKYVYVGMWLIKQVLRRYSQCFAIGMGGADRPLPKLLGSMGFAVWSVPFFAMIANVPQAVRELQMLGPPRRRRAAAAVLRVTGTGALASTIWKAAAGGRSRGAGVPTAHPIDEWGSWASEVWAAARSSFSIAAVRDARTLHALFPLDDSRFPAFRLDDRGRTIGWVVVGLRRMVANPHFGNLAVGTIVDGLTLPGREVAAVRAATRLLLGRGADVVITNQSHPAWRAACRRAGFVRGPSNYALATSPALLGRDVDIGAHDVQFTRGDGDGRVHL